MKKNIFLALILISILGCGAQNNPTEKDTPSNTTNDNSMVVSESQNLPTTINIAFLETIRSFSQNSLFDEDIQRINGVVAFIKEELSLIEPLMPKIIKECENKKRCSFSREDFEEIIFWNNDLNQTYPYQLHLKINSAESLALKWLKDKSDVLTTYQKKFEKTTVHYLVNSENKEAMIVKEKREGEYTNFIVQQEKRDYHLISNHIKNTSFNFSSNIRFKDALLVEYNENIFKLEKSIKELNDGDYLILSLNQKVETLKLIEVLGLAQGVVSLFNGESQGFLFNRGLKEYRYFKF